MIIILLGCFILIPWLVSKSGGTDTIVQGFGGLSGSFKNFFSAESFDVFLAFGIPVTIGLLAGPFGDQSFWQRAFATKKECVKGAFIRGALIFAIVPIFMSIPGFIAAAKGIKTDDAQLINLQVFVQYMPPWAVIFFVFMLLSGLVSTLDSNLCSISGIAGHDILDKESTEENSKIVLKYSRAAMAIVALLAVLIGNIPGISILHLFLFYGTVRASVLLPTVISLLKNDTSEKGIFWGIMASFVFGIPVFAYGSFYKIVSLKVTGALVTVLLSGLITIIVSKIKGSQNEVSSL